MSQWAPVAFRVDTYRIDRVERTPGSAGLRVPAMLTRSGVFEYTDPDGRVVKEYRPPEEVTKADSLATYDDAHVTIGHPPAGVTPDTYGTLSVGHIRAGSVRADDKGQVHGILFLGRGDAIGRVDSRDLVETSMGYKVDLDNTPGTAPDGTPYDRVQRNIVANHIALLARGDSRLGTTLRLDSKGDQCTCQDAPARSDEHLPWDECMAKAMKEYGDKEQAQKVCGAIKAANDSKDRKGLYTMKIDGKEVPAEGVVAALAALEADRDAQKKRADEAQARSDARDAQERRAALEAKAAKAGVPLTRKDGANEVTVDDVALKVAIITRADSTFVYDAAKHSATYLDAAVDFALKATAPANAAAPALAELNGTATGARADAAGRPTPAEIIAKAKSGKR